MDGEGDMEQSGSGSSSVVVSSTRKFEEVRKYSANKESVWYYYMKEVNGSTAKCKDRKCQATIKTVGGSTSGLHAHLKSKHDTDLLKKSSKNMDNDSDSHGMKTFALNES